MVLQKLWVSQNFSRISRVSLSRFLAVMYLSQSRFSYEGVSDNLVPRTCLYPGFGVGRESQGKGPGSEVGVLQSRFFARPREFPRKSQS